MPALRKMSFAQGKKNVVLVKIKSIDKTRTERFLEGVQEPMKDLTGNVGGKHLD